MMIVPTLCVGMPPRTLRVRSRMWRICVPKLQRYPRHALGSLNPQSVPFVTRSVTGFGFHTDRESAPYQQRQPRVQWRGRVDVEVLEQPLIAGP